MDIFVHLPICFQIHVSIHTIHTAWRHGELCFKSRARQLQAMVIAVSRAMDQSNCIFCLGGLGSGLFGMRKSGKKHPKTPIPFHNKGILFGIHPGTNFGKKNMENEHVEPKITCFVLRNVIWTTPSWLLLQNLHFQGNFETNARVLPPFESTFVKQLHFSTLATPWRHLLISWGNSIQGEKKINHFSAKHEKGATTLDVIQ